MQADRSVGLVLGAPASSAGKTTVALALMAALRARGLPVRAAKSGPDYIDPAFHAVATGAASITLDAWAMDADSLRGRAAATAGAPLLVEGAMGVLDGAPPDGRGSVADLAEHLDLPLLLVINAARMSQTAALPVAGLLALRPRLRLCGVILNRVGSPRHADMASRAIGALGIDVLGTLPRSAGLSLPSRHLGLVQAAEHPELARFLSVAAALAEAHIDLDRVLAAAAPLPAPGATFHLPPLGQRIAVARDTAFAFAYPHLLDDWRAAGAEILPFSPLQDGAPDPTADAIFMPGGYPELSAGRLASAETFRAGMTDAARRGVLIYGECGGYMVLGRSLRDADGVTHPMLGLLPVTTDFAERRLSLGYRQLSAAPGGAWAGDLRGHEFHYAIETTPPDGTPLFEARDATGQPLPPMGRIEGRVMGSFAHVIGPAPAGG